MLFLEISGESISTECYLGLFWGDHLEEPKSETILGKPFLKTNIWDNSGETISKNQNMDHSGETIFKNQYLGPFWGKYFEEPKSGTIPRTNFQPHYHTQAPVLRYKVLAPGTSVLPPPGRPPYLSFS